METQRVSASRTVPLFLRNRERFERFFFLLKVLLFLFSFSLAKFQMPQLASDNSATSLVSLKLSTHDLLSEI